MYRIFSLSSFLFLFIGCQQNPENSIAPTPVFENTSHSSGISLSYIQDCAMNPVSMDSPCFVTELFGYNNFVTSVAPAPITTSGTYQTPSTVATGFTIVSTSTDDAYGGSGANLIKITGLDANWELQSEIVAMSGTTPAPLVNDYIRIFDTRILVSGTYATTTTGSYAGEITVSSGGEVWSKILPPASGVQFGESAGCVYTVPKGFSAYVLNGNVHVSESENKSANIYLYSRSFADNTTTPGSILTHYVSHGVKGSLPLFENRLIGRFDGPADLGVMALSNDTGDVQVYAFATILFIRN